MEKNILFTVGVLATLSGMSVNAKSNVVVYRCPTISEIDSMETKTTINKKTVHWETKYNSNRSYDEPVEFLQIVLNRKDPHSYDRSVSCIYRTKDNKKYTLQPVSSFHWYVDGIAEKALGKYWHEASNGSLKCSDSVKTCLFQFR